MACIICFLDDSHQISLREELKREDDEFINTLKEYKKIFVTEYESLCDVSECPEHKKINPETIKWCQQLHSILPKPECLRDWFDSIEVIYQMCTSNECDKAYKKLDELLKYQDIFKEQNASKYMFCIRGCRERESKTPLTKDDMFHIPFNKKEEIGSNGRYNKKGSPQLYFGLSTVAIFHELGAKNGLDKIYFSSFALKNPNGIRIVDLTNQFSHIYSEIKPTHEDGFLIDLNHSFNMGIRKQCPAELYKFVLSLICSFPKKNKKTCPEEYLIPQLLSEWAIRNGYDGISYSSTRVTNEQCYSEEIFYSNKYRENIVFFVKESDSTEKGHDQKLMEKFCISEPIIYTDIKDINYDKFLSLKTEIENLNTLKNERGVFLNSFGSDFTTHYDKLIVKEDSSTDIQYREHPLGKIHISILYKYMLHIRNYLKNSNNPLII